VSTARLDALENLSADLRIVLGDLDDGIVVLDREALVLDRLRHRISGLGDDALLVGRRCRVVEALSIRLLNGYDLRERGRSGIELLIC
jgi:hypothetical protein